MERALPLGIHAGTGQLLDEVVPPSALDSVDEDPEEIKSRPGKVLGAAIGDANHLNQAGWCVVFPGNKDCSDLKAQLEPLLKLRAGQAPGLFSILEGDQGYQPGDSAEKWLKRRHLDLRTVDPFGGVPYYVLIVGSPDEIPFEFQYKLDSFWAVGRLYFDAIPDYGKYAQKVVDAEQTEVPKTAAIVATRHKGDSATQFLHDYLAVPLLTGDEHHPPLGSSGGFKTQPLLADQATKQNILDLLAGKRAGGRPSLLFTGSHGVSFESNDPHQRIKQGALLCGDFPAVGEVVTPDRFLCEADLAGLALDGMIHFCFACYSAGCPANDTYDRQPDGSEKPLMPNPIVAKLPQGVLARGALAVFGHIDRAWTSSFKGVGQPQIQDFRFVLEQILQGVRVGHATDLFNQRWSGLSNSLSDMLKNRQVPGQVSDDELTEMWKVRNDARNYVILGDPAVRLNC